ncbi:amidohydrolase family protein [Syntrophus buswellii]|jgi:predicted TIM-barrel fold metal-dependent hydrolase|uniref:amidohydrolase family protein n=1 Tax=Syntrophus buswellii TaxID=43774 RepID=UPI0009D5BB93|nr:MAG: Amidohydrolase [Syntrophus sp. PtaB.Bin138]
MKIIDARVRMRTDLMLKPWTTELKPYYRDYVSLYKMKSRLSVMPVEEQFSYAERAGIERMVVCGMGDAENEHVLELSRRYDRVIPVAGVSVEIGIRHALRDISKYKEQGIAAIQVTPHIHKRDVHDRHMYPVYGLCELMKIPVIVHGSVHFWRGSYMWHGQPQYIDEVAVDFPELKMIVSHGGNGFGPPMLAVAQRHPNIYLEFSALNPIYMAPEFLYAANSYLRGKCLFGTDYPLVDFEVAVQRWKKVLQERTQELFFHQNVLDALYGEPVPF